MTRPAQRRSAWQTVGATRAGRIRAHAQQLTIVSGAVALASVVALVGSFGSVPRDPLGTVAVILAANTVLITLVCALALDAARRRFVTRDAIDLHRGRDLVVGLGLYVLLAGWLVGVGGVSALTIALSPLAPVPAVTTVVTTATATVGVAALARWFGWRD